MKKPSPILQITSGERGHFDNIKLTAKEIKLLDKVIEYDNTLRNKLQSAPELLEDFKQFQDAMHALEAEQADSYYLEGFRFGALIAMDILTPPN